MSDINLNFSTGQVILYILIQIFPIFIGIAFWGILFKFIFKTSKSRKIFTIFSFIILMVLLIYLASNIFTISFPG